MKRSFPYRHENDNLIYKPPLTCLQKIDLIFPWLGKEYKIKYIPFKKKGTT